MRYIPTTPVSGLMTAWRLLVTEPHDGATNMAVDEALLRSRLSGDGPPTVRFFAWDPPTISLGYGQRVDAAINLSLATGVGIGLVRRPTGGSAVYHDSWEREVTYSVVASADDHPGFDDLLETYRIIGSALVSGLRRLGVRADLVPARRLPGGPPAFCFARTGSYEVEVEGKKIIGSAQRRQSGAFLQHGSILLGANAERLRALFPQDDPLGEMTTIETVLDCRPSFRETVEAMVSGFEAVFGTRLSPGEISGKERALIERLVLAKYAAPAWTERGEVRLDLEETSRPRTPARSC